MQTHPFVFYKIFQAFWRRQFTVGISLTYCLLQILSMCLNYYMFAVFLTHRVPKLWHMKLLNYTWDNESFLTKVSATNMGDCTCTGLVKQVDLLLWPGCPKNKIHKKTFLWQTQWIHANPLMSSPMVWNTPMLQKALKTIVHTALQSRVHHAPLKALPFMHSLLYPPMDFAPLCTAETFLLKENFWPKSWKHIYDNKCTSHQAQHAAEMGIPMAKSSEHQ